MDLKFNTTFASIMKDFGIPMGTDKSYKGFEKVDNLKNVNVKKSSVADMSNKASVEKDGVIKRQGGLGKPKSTLDQKKSVEPFKRSK